VVLVQRGSHGSFFNPQKRAVADRRGCHHAKRLACNASLTKETAIAKDSDNRCLPVLGSDGELHPSFLDVEDRLGGISLHENIAFLWALYDFGFGPKSAQEDFRIKMRAPVL
jgi:hypothetical protein